MGQRQSAKLSEIETDDTNSVGCKNCGLFIHSYETIHLGIDANKDVSFFHT